MAGKENKKKGSRLIAILLALLLVLILAAGGAYLYTRFARVGGEVIRTDVSSLDLQDQDLSGIRSLARFRDLQELDLRGNEVSAADLEYLQRHLPDCHIRYDVPLGGEAWDSDLTALTLTDLPEDWKNILLFPRLEELTVEKCTNPEAMETLREALPDCRMKWALCVGGDWYDSASQSLRLTSGSIYYEELLSQLTWFRELESVVLTDAVLKGDQQRSLLAAFPAVSFAWPVAVGDAVLHNGADTILYAQTGEKTVEALENAADLLPELKAVDFTGSMVPAEDRLAFRDRHPEMTVTWSVSLNGNIYPWDVEMLDFNNIPMTDTSDLEDTIPYLPCLKTVEMCDCGLSNEDMDSLNQRWPDVRFIWNVHFAGYTLRTDATYFCASMDGLNHPYLTNSDVSVFRYLTDMQGLDLGHMYITDISFLQYMPHMTYLIIAECNIEDYTPLAYCKELKYLEDFQTIINDISPLLECPVLRDLNLSYTCVSAKNAWEVLTQLTSLERLWWCGCPLNSRQRTELMSYLPDTYMFFLNGGEPSGGSWRYHQNYFEMRDFFHMYYMPGGSNGVDDAGAQIVVDDRGREFHLFDYDGGIYWWTEEKYASLGWYPYIIGVTA